MMLWKKYLLGAFISLFLLGFSSPIALADDPAEIIPGKLYISSIAPALNQDVLNKIGIKAILNLTGPEYNTDKPRYPNAFPDLYSYLHLCIKDEIHVKIQNYFKVAHQFIEKSIDSNQPVLVHCEAGISRSSTIIISYLIQHENMTLRNAYKFVQSKKNNIAPNIDFFRSLIDLEASQYTRSNFEEAIPSITLEEYLIEQMLLGPAMGMKAEAVKDALTASKFNVDRALAILWGE